MSTPPASGRFRGGSPSSAPRRRPSLSHPIGPKVLTEIPLAHRSVSSSSSVRGVGVGGRGRRRPAEEAARFALSDGDGGGRTTVRRATTAATGPERNGGLEAHDDEDDRLLGRNLKGSASVSTISLPSVAIPGGEKKTGKRDALIVTSALPRSPSVLTVSVLGGGGGGSGSGGGSGIELDLSGLDGFGGGGGSTTAAAGAATAKVGCFLDDGFDLDDGGAFVDISDDGGYSSSVPVRLVAVDAVGRVLSLPLTLTIEGRGAGANDGNGERFLLVPDGTFLLRSVQGIIDERNRRAAESAETRRRSGGFAKMLRVHPGATVNPSSVTLLSSSRILMAMSPHVLSIDLTTGTVVPWSERKCLESKGTLAKAFDMLLGRVGDPGEYDDLDDDEDEERTGATSPVAALCSTPWPPASDDETEEERTKGRRFLIFTLHADGVARAWSTRTAPAPSTIGNDDDDDAAAAAAERRKALHPLRVRTLRISGTSTLPSPASWSTAPDAVSLAATVCSDPYGPGTVYALALHVRTTTAPLRSLSAERDGAAARSNGARGTCHLLVARGPPPVSDADDAKAVVDSASGLNVPDAAVSLADFAFAAPNGKGGGDGDAPRLHALFRSLGGGASTTTAQERRSRHSSPRKRSRVNRIFDEEEGREALLACYVPAVTAFVGGDAVTWEGGCHALEEDAATERESILSCVPSTKSILQDLEAAETKAKKERKKEGKKEEDAGAALERTLREVDAEYMKRIFRPTGDRGAGGGPVGPTTDVVRRALRRVVPYYRPKSANSEGGAEMEVLRAMAEWTDRVERTGGGSSSSSEAVTPAAKEKDDTRGEGGGGPMSVYRAFATPGKVRGGGARTGGDGADRDGGVAAHPESGFLFRDDDDIDAMEEDDDEDIDEEEKVRRRKVRESTAKLRARHNRWTELRIAVWEEERSLRVPLTVVPFSLPSSRVVDGRGIGGGSLAAEAIAVVVRAGLTTAMCRSSVPRAVDDGDDDVGATFRALDDLALSVLANVPRNDDPNDDATSSSLGSVVHKIEGLVARATFATPRRRVGAELVLKDLGRLGSLSLSSTYGGGGTEGDAEERGADGSSSEPRVARASKLLSSAPRGTLLDWLDTTSFSAGGGGGAAAGLAPGPVARPPPDGEGAELLPTTTAIDGIAADSPDDDFDDVLSSASHVSLRYVSSTVRLRLARCLLVLGTDDSVADAVDADVRQSAVRSYLHAVAVRWCCSQVAESSSTSSSLLASGGSGAGGAAGGGGGAAPTPSRPVLGRPTAEAGRSPTAPPLAKRPGPDPSSAVNGSATPSAATALDAHLRHLLRTMTATAPTRRGRTGPRDDDDVALPTRLAALPVRLARAFAGRSFGEGSPQPAAVAVDDVAATGRSGELGALPPPASSSVTDHPRLALRLLAPCVAYPPPRRRSYSSVGAGGRRAAEVEADAARKRRETAAECLLVEATSLSRLSGGASEEEERKVLELRKTASALLLDYNDRYNDKEHDDDEEDEEEQEDEDDLGDFFSSGKVGFEILRDFRRHAEEDWTEPPASASAGEVEDGLASALGRMLQPKGGGVGPPDSSFVGEDVRRLSKLPSVQSLFLPAVEAANAAGTDVLSYLRGGGAVAEGYDDDPGRHVRSLARILLRASNLAIRVSVLERYVPIASSSSRGTCFVVLSSIRDVARVMETYLPSDMRRRMKEYSALWSSMFLHAMNGEVWDMAYRACRSHPILQLKRRYYRMLVMGMVDAGALGDLIDMCAEVVPGGKASSTAAPGGSGGGGAATDEADFAAEELLDFDGPSGGCADLYELAAETLAEAAKERSVRGVAYDVVPRPVDYGACLYAVHASRGHWRRAAKAMDLRLDVAVDAASSSSATGSAARSEAVERRIVDDASLSALGSANAIRLAGDPSRRFLVAGEAGMPHPLPPVLLRGLESAPPAVDAEGGSSAEGTVQTSRLSRFLSESDLAKRAVRAAALQTVFLDGTTPSTSSALSALRPHRYDGSEAANGATTMVSDRDLIDELASLGYHHSAMRLARSTYAAEGKDLGGQPRIRPGGRDEYYDAVSHVLCRYVVPAAVAGGRRLRRDGKRHGAASARPTEAQLRLPVDGDNGSVPSGRTGAASIVVVAPPDSKSAAAMDLLRRCVVAHSNCDNSIALEVAGMILDLDGGRSTLPIWLEDLLLGVRRGGEAGDGPSEQGRDGDGLFAAVRRAGGRASVAADPAGLVRLYMTRGLYVRACDAVSSVLLRGGDGGERSATSRLPERGDIDYVPYGTIDMLWNLIEASKNSNKIDYKEKGRMIEARRKMEGALQRHFELMKVSEAGMQSARALYVP